MPQFLWNGIGYVSSAERMGDGIDVTVVFDPPEDRKPLTVSLDRTIGGRVKGRALVLFPHATRPDMVIFIWAPYTEGSVRESNLPIEVVVPRLRGAPL